jgi:hypothetical protein
MLLILAIWEDEIRRIWVPGQPEQIVLETSPPNLLEQNEVEVWLCRPKALSSNPSPTKFIWLKKIRKHLFLLNSV